MADVLQYSAVVASSSDMHEKYEVFLAKAMKAIESAKVTETTYRDALHAVRKKEQANKVAMVNAAKAINAASSILQEKQDIEGSVLINGAVDAIKVAEESLLQSAQEKKTRKFTVLL